MDQSPPPATPPAHVLPRAIGPWIGIAIVVGTVIGSGVFRKPSAVAQNVPDVWMVAAVWIMGGLLTLLGTLVLAEIAVLFPLSGGNYIFLREGYGRLTGFLYGWVAFWVVHAASIAALATTFVDALHDVLKIVLAYENDWLSQIERIILTICVIVILAAVNIRGVRWGGGLQLVITLVKVWSLLAILVVPFLFLDRIRVPDNIGASLFDQPRSTELSITGVGAAMLGVLWAYHGWMSLAPMAGEVTRPQRNLPIAFITGMAIIIFVYLGANLAYSLTLSMREMAGLSDNQIAAAEFALRLLGPTGKTLILTAIMFSTFGALNGNLLAGPRLVFAMAEDGLAPRWFAAIHSRFQTPAAAITLLAGWSIALTVAGVLAKAYFMTHLEKRSLFDMMTDFAMFGAVIFETLAITTIFLFRQRMPDAARPYRCPWYPLIPVLYLPLPAFMLSTMFVNQPLEAAAGAVFIGVGVVVYFVWLWFRGTDQKDAVKSDVRIEQIP